MKPTRANPEFSNPMTQAEPNIKGPKPIIAENQLTQFDFDPIRPIKLHKHLNIL